MQLKIKFSSYLKAMMTLGRAMKTVSYHHNPSDAFSHSKQGQGDCGEKAFLGAEPTNTLSLLWVRTKCVLLGFANPIKRGKASWLLVKAKG